MFLIDEGSQIDDSVATRLRMALSELPHLYVIVVAADYRQLQPIDGGGVMLNWCIEMEQFFLKEVHRTKDPELLSFLHTIRTEQPSRQCLREFWNASRHLPADLLLAVKVSLELQRIRGQHFMWLCVTNKGANEINQMALRILDVTSEELKQGFTRPALTRYLFDPQWDVVLEGQKGKVNVAQRVEERG